MENNGNDRTSQVLVQLEQSVELIVQELTVIFSELIGRPLVGTYNFYHNKEELTEYNLTSELEQVSKQCQHSSNRYNYENSYSSSNSSSSAHSNSNSYNDATSNNNSHNNSIYNNSYNNDDASSYSCFLDCSELVLALAGQFNKNYSNYFKSILIDHRLSLENINSFGVEPVLASILAHLENSYDSNCYNSQSNSYSPRGSVSEHDNNYSKSNINSDSNSNSNRDSDSCSIVDSLFANYSPLEVGGGSGLGMQLYCDDEVIVTSGAGGGGGILLTEELVLGDESTYFSHNNSYSVANSTYGNNSRGKLSKILTFGGGGGGGLQLKAINNKSSNSGLTVDNSGFVSIGGGGGCGTCDTDDSVTDTLCFYDFSDKEDVSTISSYNNSGHEQSNSGINDNIRVSCGYKRDDNSLTDSELRQILLELFDLQRSQNISDSSNSSNSGKSFENSVSSSSERKSAETIHGSNCNSFVIRGGGGGGGGVGNCCSPFHIGYGFSFTITSEKSTSSIFKDNSTESGMDNNNGDNITSNATANSHERNNFDKDISSMRYQFDFTGKIIQLCSTACGGFKSWCCVCSCAQNTVNYCHSDGEKEPTSSDYSNFYKDYYSSDSASASNYEKSADHKSQPDGSVVTEEVISCRNINSHYQTISWMLSTRCCNDIDINANKTINLFQHLQNQSEIIEIKNNSTNTTSDHINNRNDYYNENYNYSNYNDNNKNYSMDINSSANTIPISRTVVDNNRLENQYLYSLSSKKLLKLISLTTNESVNIIDHNNRIMDKIFLTMKNINTLSDSYYTNSCRDEVINSGYLIDSAVTICDLIVERKINKESLDKSYLRNYSNSSRYRNRENTNISEINIVQIERSHPLFSRIFMCLTYDDHNVSYDNHYINKMKSKLNKKEHKTNFTESVGYLNVTNEFIEVRNSTEVIAYTSSSPKLGNVMDIRNYNVLFILLTIAFMMFVVVVIVKNGIKRRFCRCCRWSRLIADNEERDLLLKPERLYKATNYNTYNSSNNDII